MVPMVCNFFSTNTYQGPWFIKVVLQEHFWPLCSFPYLELLLVLFHTFLELCYSDLRVNAGYGYIQFFFLSFSLYLEGQTSTPMSVGYVPDRVLQGNEVSEQHSSWLTSPEFTSWIICQPILKIITKQT